MERKYCVRGAEVKERGVDPDDLMFRVKHNVSRQRSEARVANADEGARARICVVVRGVDGNTAGVTGADAVPRAPARQHRIFSKWGKDLGMWVAGSDSALLCRVGMDGGEKFSAADLALVCGGDAVDGSEIGD